MGGETEPGTAAAETEPTPFAAKAKDLGALRDAVVDAGTVGTGLWISYLFALFYFAIAAGAVTHRDLLVENPVKLPFLNVELPLKSFFILGPLVFLIVHAYVLLHFVLLAGKIGAFHTELQAQISDVDARARLRRQLPSNIFVQFLSGPPEVRHGIVGFLLKLVAWLSLVAGPIALLILLQLQFLPYHSGWITMWQRIAVVIDIALLWILWPSIARGETAWLGWSDFRRAKVGALVLASFLPVLLVVTIATFPGEWLEEKMPPVRFIPTTWKAWTLPSVQAIQAPGSGWTTLHELLVAGKVILVTGSPQSLWSNVLVVPRFVARDTVKFDEAEGKVAVSSNPLSLRGRSLEGAVLVLAHLRRADFTGARLTGAYFVGADLRKAKFRCDEIGDINELSGARRGVESDEPAICTQLQRANLDLADLQDANLKYAELHHARLVGAKLQGADLTGARLEGADLTAANLEGANLTAVELRAADLDGTQLPGAKLGYVDLRAANLDGTELQGANLDHAQLQGANLDGTQLQGASLDHAQLQAAFLSDTQLQGASLDYAQLQAASVVGAQMQGASLVGAQMDGALLRNVFVWRTTAPSNATQVVVMAPEPGPKYSGLGCVRVGCEWSETSYLSLKSLIENSVPAGHRRDQTLQRIKALAKPPYVADARSAKAWTDLTGYAASAGSYVNTRAKVFKEIGCSDEGAPYVIGALIKYLDKLSDYNLLQKLAAAFLDEVRCPGARGLGKEYKEALQEIRDRDLPASPGPSISAQ